MVLRGQAGLKRIASGKYLPSECRLLLSAELQPLPSGRSLGQRGLHVRPKFVLARSPHKVYCNGESHF